MTRHGDWIQTYTGGQFWPMDPSAEDVNIVDIAHALSMLCRFGGHCRRFYSVAEHSLLLSRAVAPENALWALLHDATEAYLCDVPRPTKPFLIGYRQAEERIMAVIAERFGLSGEMPAEVKEADGRILADEAAQNMAPPPQAWNPTGSPLNVQLLFESPEDAKRGFLHRFTELTVVGA